MDDGKHSIDEPQGIEPADFIVRASAAEKFRLLR